MGQKIALNTYKPSPYRLKVLFCSLGSARSKILGCWDIWKLWAMLRLHRPVAPWWGEAEMLDCPPQTAELTWAAVSQPSAQPGAQILCCQNSPKWDAHASKSNTNVCWAILSSLKDLNQDILSQASWPSVRKSGLDRRLLWWWCYTGNLSPTLYIKRIDSLGRWYDNWMLIRIENFCKMSSNWILISRYLK